MESYNQAPSFQHHSFCPSLWFWLVPTNKQICSRVNLLNPHSLSSNFSPFTTLYALLSWKENFSGNIYSYSFSCPQFFLLLKKKNQSTLGTCQGELDLHMEKSNFCSLFTWIFKHHLKRWFLPSFLEHSFLFGVLKATFTWFSMCSLNTFQAYLFPLISSFNF